MIIIEEELLGSLSDKAQTVERKRLNYNFHKEYTDSINRLLNAIEPGSYIRPHKHDTPDKREIFIILKGRIAVVEFDNEGNFTDSIVLDANDGIYGVEIAPKVWHTILSLKKGSVIYEIKDGPYEPINDKNFASWAPKENTVEASKYLNNLIRKLHLQ